MFKIDDRAIQPGTPFEHNGILFAANWTLLTPEERADVGIVEVPDEAPVDGRFFFSAGNPRPLSDCIAVHVNAINAYVSSAMTQSDWMVTREAEGYKPAPASVVAYRKAVRDHGNALVAEVKALTEVSDVVAWQPHDWPVDPNAKQ